MRVPAGGDLRRVSDGQQLPAFGQPRQPFADGACHRAADAAVDLVENDRRRPALLGQRDAEQAKQLASLVKTYSAMKPKDAARIFDSLTDQVLVPVAAEMKSDVLAPVLAAMSPDRAQKLTVRLADRLTLPETAAAPAAATAMAAPVQGTPAAGPANPVPGQTASLAPAAAPVAAPAKPAPEAPKTGG